MRDLRRPSRRFFIAAALLALVLGGFAAMVVDAQRDSRHDLEQRFQLRSVLAARFVESFIAETARQERAVAKMRLADTRVRWAEFEAVAERFGFVGAVLLDSRGRLLQVYPRRDEILGSPIADRYAHLRGAVNGRTSVSGVVPSAARRIPVVAVAVPFRSRVGRRVFSGAFAVQRSPIALFLRNAVPLSLGSARLLDANRTPIDGTGRLHEDSFVAETPVRGTGWRVQLGAPRSQLFAPVSGMTEWVQWLLFAGLALAAIAILTLVFRLLANHAELQERNREVLRLMRVQQGFVATTSHELKTPLTSVLGYLELVLSGRAGPLADDGRRFLEVARRNAERLVDLASDLLVAAQIDAGKLELHPEEITLDDVARETVENAQPQAVEKGIQLVLELDGRPRVEGDPTRLAQVIGNLISNAVKFTPSDGRVEVRSFSENGTGVIEVSDTGIGIPEEEQERLFQRFFRASTAFESNIPGTGLGLAIAHSIADLHGGTLTCRSKRGSGSTFRLELPASK